MSRRQMIITRCRKGDEKHVDSQLGMGLVLGFGCFVFKKYFVERRKRRRNAEVLGRFDFFFP